MSYGVRSPSGAKGAEFRYTEGVYQLPPPPPPPPPPEEPPPPNPLELPELGGVDAIALERLEFIDSRLLERNAAWNGALTAYQLLVGLVSAPSKALGQRGAQPETMG